MKNQVTVSESFVRSAMLVALRRGEAASGTLLRIAIDQLHTELDKWAFESGSDKRYERRLKVESSTREFSPLEAVALQAIKACSLRFYISEVTPLGRQLKVLTDSLDVWAVESRRVVDSERTYQTYEDFIRNGGKV